MSGELKFQESHNKLHNKADNHDAQGDHDADLHYFFHYESSRTEA